MLIIYKKYEFTIYIVRYLEGFFVNQHFILHEESKLPAQQLLRAVGAWYYQLHEEIWVFNQGFWQNWELSTEPLEKYALVVDTLWCEWAPFRPCLVVRRNPSLV